MIGLGSDKNDWFSQASLLTAFPGPSFWCFLCLKLQFFLCDLKKTGEMLKSFLHFEEPGSSSLLVLSTPSCADTSSTIASLVTFSTPSLAEGLLLRKSWTVPCFLNFFKSLVHDCHRLGGGACCLGWPPDDENPVKETKCW